MRAIFSTAVLTGIVTFAAQAAEAPVQPAAHATESRAVMTGDQIVEILDETVDWYRTLGAQQQAATQPSDLLILYANRQTADKVVALAFEIARANAELLASEAGVKKEAEDAASSQSLSRLRKRLDEQRTSIQREIETTRRQLAGAPKPKHATLQSRISLLQGQLDLVNARRNMVGNMSQFASETDTTGFGANALKAHIDAIAASIPAASGTPAPVSSSTSSAAATAGSDAAASGSALSRFGIWDLAATVFRLSAKARTIDQIDQRTAELEETFKKIRTPPLDQLKRLTDRGDALAAEAESGANANLRGVRDQYDTLAWLFQQTSAIVTPLSKAGVLLSQYRRNLSNWRAATQKQYRDAFEALGLRVALFAGLLAIVFGLGHLWRRVVFRYVHEARRRSRLLLLQKIVLWALVVAIVASTFVTELGSLATFAGLITAGLAVAMQSVLVSIVGYFFLIGKYGIRVGDRVQVGSVTGEVIEMGLVRLHLMELSGEGQMSPTGRVVAFANSIIFQSSGGLFKQIPGVNLAWHEVTFNLPTGSDYAALKDKMVQAVTRVIADYLDDMVRQTREIQKAASSHDSGDPQPSVQLRFSAASVDAIVRYPVQLSHAAEIDERV
ncbi:MAG TPA: mechanosensitive ion channel domain-containing protein, partial [Steroidobacteraceae bacterium]|nr:mechanosensitive ion channel domain-containing protein [Steroidobacteraceae bacterium]